MWKEPVDKLNARCDAIEKRLAALEPHKAAKAEAKKPEALKPAPAPKEKAKPEPKTEPLPEEKPQP